MSSRNRSLLAIADAPQLLPAARHSRQANAPVPLNVGEAQLIAAVLATWPDIAHEPLFATEYGVDWYHRLLTPLYCSYDDAALVRECTIVHCRQVRAERLQREGKQLRRLVMDEHGRAQNERDHVAGVTMLLILFGIFFVYWLVSPTDQQLRDITFGKQTVEQVSR